jgi:NADPH:quinone reductase-like Zn-dependent oxidoreductase
MSAVESRAIRFHEVGEPLDVLQEEQTQIPDPGEGTIRVRVAATGLNPADWELCRGFMPGVLPRGIGVDVCGTVNAIGDGVADVAVGDLVFGSSDFVAQPSAGAADFAILNLWFAVPAGLDAVHAAVLPMVLQTAHWTLDLMNVKSGETVLIHGAGGMVGYAAVQLALRRGARVIATAGPTFASDLEGFGAIVTPYGEGMVERVRSLADGPIDHVLDASRPNTGAIAALIEITGDPTHVVTISNHDEARSQGASRRPVHHPRGEEIPARRVARRRRTQPVGSAARKGRACAVARRPWPAERPGAARTSPVSNGSPASEVVLSTGRIALPDSCFARRRAPVRGRSVTQRGGC